MNFTDRADWVAFIACLAATIAMIAVWVVNA